MWFQELPRIHELRLRLLLAVELCVLLLFSVPSLLLVARSLPNFAVPIWRFVESFSEEPAGFTEFLVLLFKLQKREETTHSRWNTRGGQERTENGFPTAHMQRALLLQVQAKVAIRQDNETNRIIAAAVMGRQT